MNRRSFLESGAWAAAGVGLGLSGATGGLAAAPRLGVKLGMDNFSVRALGLKAGGLLDLASALKLDSLYITSLDALENFEAAYLREVRAKAKDLGLDILLGTWSICPGSRAFNKKWGTAEEHLALGIRLAQALGSPLLRVVLGTREDRKSEGGIEARIEETVGVCRSLRSRAMDAGVKISIENHAGDLQASELIHLIEAAGKDYVGATFDSGNSTWTMEDPTASLDLLAPYVLSTHIRDSMIWETAEGAKVQWTAVGEGCIDSKAFFAKLTRVCPGVPVHLEIISGFAVDFPYLKPGFWDVWPKARGQDLAAFVALAKQGKPIDPFRPPEGKDRREAEQEYQKAELERSIRYCREEIGLGLK